MRLQLNQVWMVMDFLYDSANHTQHWRRPRLAKEVVANEYRRAAGEAMPNSLFASWEAQLPLDLREHEIGK